MNLMKSMLYTSQVSNLSGLLYGFDTVSSGNPPLLQVSQK
jgi:hypothetical protein